MSTLSQTVVQLRPGDRITGMIIDGSTFQADVVDVECDQSGIRAVLIPPGISLTTARCRLRTHRVGNNWGTIYFERREGNQWSPYGEVIELTCR